MRKDERDELVKAVDGLSDGIGGEGVSYRSGFIDALDKVTALIDEAFRKPRLRLGDKAALQMAVSFLERKGFEVIDREYRGFILCVKDGDWVFVEPRLADEGERLNGEADRRAFEDAASDWIVEGDGHLRCDVLAMKQLSPTSMMFQHHMDALR